MKAIMVMFDSLNRHMLAPYGCDWVHTPNFQRLAERAVTFDNCYVGSMPCIPARRELHTGRYNFLHRSWGPLEPFDDSMPQILRENGVYTHLVTDHRHYFEDGGTGYHTRYSSWEYFRGQEGDLWKGHVAEPEMPQDLHGRRGQLYYRQHFVNKHYFHTETDYPQAQTFAAGIEFMRTNHAADNWFLQIETFDPHEPFLSPPGYKALYPDDYDGPAFDWPGYRQVDETPAAVAHIRNQYAALVTMCDTYLGKVLDEMDRLDLWADTMLIVNTDHGFLLSEHDWWGKVMMPFYNEVARTPLFIWDPRAGNSGARRRQLVQMIDMAPTLLEYFGVARTPDMQGVPLGPVLADDTPTREAVLYGMFGAHVNVTDGRTTYMRAPVDLDVPYYYYTLLPAHMLNYFTLEELRGARLTAPFSFMKGVPPLAVPVAPRDDRARLMLERKGASIPTLTNHLFDLETDPGQKTELHDTIRESRMLSLLIDLMAGNDAPPELYRRLGLIPPDDSL